MIAVQRKLIVSFHDLHPGSRDCCQRFIDRCHDLGVDRLTLLVVPRFHGDSAFTVDLAFVEWLRRMANAGHELCLHGYTHKAAQITGGLRSQLVGRVYTAGEGEFRDLTSPEASELLTRGLDLFRAARLPVYGFTPPAWLLGADARSALAATGLLYNTQWNRVELLSSGEMVAAPTLVYSARSRWRRWLSRLWVSYYQRRNRDQQVLRIAAHPIDFEHPDIERHLYEVVESAARDRAPATYCELVPAALRKPVTPGST